MRKNYLLNFAVDLPFEFLYSHLHSGLSKTTGANCRWIRSQLQTCIATGYISLSLKESQQQLDLCPGLAGQRASLNREGTSSLGYFHMSTQSSPPSQLHFKSLYGFPTPLLQLAIIKYPCPSERKGKGILDKYITYCYMFICICIYIIFRKFTKATLINFAPWNGKLKI